VVWRRVRHSEKGEQGCELGCARSRTNLWDDKKVGNIGGRLAEYSAKRTTLAGGRHHKNKNDMELRPLSKRPASHQSPFRTASTFEDPFPSISRLYFTYTQSAARMRTLSNVDAAPSRPNSQLLHPSPAIKFFTGFLSPTGDLGCSIISSNKLWEEPPGMRVTSLSAVSGSGRMKIVPRPEALPVWDFD
jgi:hypothetical protein